MQSLRNSSTNKLLQKSIEMYMQMPFHRKRIPFSTSKDAIANFQSIPLLTAKEVGKHSPPHSYDLIFDRKKMGPSIETGGSLGRRKTITHSWEFNNRVISIGTRSIDCALDSPPEVIANCFHSGEFTGSFLFAEGVAQKLRAHYLPIGNLLDIEEIYEQLQSFGVDTLMATPTFHTQFFKEVEQKPPLLKLKNLFYLGETFPENERQELLKIYPQLKIVSLAYTTTETGPIGFQCAHMSGGEHHIHEDSVFVEILDPVTEAVLSPGETGEIIVTTYLNDGQPALRYKTGDLGSIHEERCPCGRNEKIILLKGRSTHSIKICGTLVQKDHLLELVNRHIDITPNNIQLVERNENGQLFLDVLINSPEMTSSQKDALFKELIKDFKFAHILSYPSTKGIAVFQRPKTQFITSDSGKTPFFTKQTNTEK